MICWTWKNVYILSMLVGYKANAFGYTCASEQPEAKNVYIFYVKNGQKKQTLGRRLLVLAAVGVLR